MNDDLMPPEELDGTMDMLEDRYDSCNIWTDLTARVCWACRQMWEGDGYVGYQN